MKSNPNGRNWNPTITLAKLFEDQYQFFDALAAYELIDQTESSPAIREKIEALHLRILTDNNAQYDPRIEKLFSPEELAYLKILNHTAFDNLSSVMNRIAEGFPETEIQIDSFDDREQIEGIDEASKMRELMLEIEKQASQVSGEPVAIETEYKLQDFLVALLSRIDKETALSEIKFSDLINIFLDMQRIKTDNS